MRETKLPLDKHQMKSQKDNEKHSNEHAFTQKNKNNNSVDYGANKRQDEAFATKDS